MAAALSWCPERCAPVSVSTGQLFLKFRTGNNYGNLDSTFVSAVGTCQLSDGRGRKKHHQHTLLMLLLFVMLTLDVLKAVAIAPFPVNATAHP